MLYPQNNPYRQARDLSGLWDFRLDPGDEGLRAGWARGFDEATPIAVPGSWNEQLAEARDDLGPAWYATRFDLPWGWEGKRVFLRFGSVNFLADVWLNGEKLGGHEGGHLPFTLELTGQARAEGNLLVARVDGRLDPAHVPPGNVTGAGNRFDGIHYPDTNFDFFPYCGIHRPVLLYAIPHEGIRDITVVTALEGSLGRVSVHVEADGVGGTVRFSLSGHLIEYAEQKPLLGEAYANMSVPNPALWQPGAPNLYNLRIELVRKGVTYDRYDLPFGIRTIEVAGDQLLLNGKPLKLRGFGRHEDFPIAGRGLVPPVLVKDFALLDWLGANSFRTSHYPYSDEMMDLADRLGVLVIDETPAVGLFFDGGPGDARRLELCRQATQEMIARDKNRPSVILWSLANEPHSRSPHAAPFFRQLCDLARELDPTRPVTLASYLGLEEESFDFLDVVCLNRYPGWYSQPGQIEAGLELLAQDLEAIHARYPKPLLVTEFGADALAGWHALPPEMFSEAYQAELIERVIHLLDRLPYVTGQHIWNLCDFKTGQAVHRAGAINHKGVFTRDRRPKLAAHKIRALWKEIKPSE